MKHIRKFNNLSEYQGFIEEGIEPHVALIITESGKVLKYKRKKLNL